MDESPPANHDASPEPRPKRGWTRRRFFKWVLGTTAAAGTGFGLYTWRMEPHWIEVVRRDLPIDRLPATLDGATLAQISDLHIGPIVDDDYIRGALDRATALKPDAIAITGDLMSCRQDEQIDKTIATVERLAAPLPPLGVLAIPGNHDYGWAWRQYPVADELARRLRGLGVRVLRNQAAEVEGLQVVGLDDMWAGRFDPADVLPTLRPGAASLTLSHNPDTCDLAGWGAWRGWILAGHTHGGQVDPPLIGAPLLPVRNRRYVEGAYDVGDGRRVYINRGLGYLRRVRFCSRPEITLFTLRRA